jgi:hypothetical protein
MKLIHWDKEPLALDHNRVYPDSERDAYFKPKGLWVSDEHDFGWSHWCSAEQFDTMGLIYEHEVELWPDHNILIIRDVEGLDKFHERFGRDLLDGLRPLLGSNPRKDWLDWRAVYPLWQGIIVTPYLWERRMEYMWYYGWDCASGAIWDLSAIRSFTLQLKQLTWKGGTK